MPSIKTITSSLNENAIREYLLTIADYRPNNYPGISEDLRERLDTVGDAVFREYGYERG